MIKGNLQRLKISEYILRLKKNIYPLLSKEQSDPDTLVDKIKFKTVNQPSSLEFEVSQIIAVLDWYNQVYTPCDYCMLPYSFRELEDKALCIFCYIQLIQRPITFYLQYDTDDKIIALSMHPGGETVKSKLFDEILGNKIDESGLQQIIDQELSKSEYVEKSLDDFL